MIWQKNLLIKTTKIRSAAFGWLIFIFWERGHIMIVSIEKWRKNYKETSYEKSSLN